MRNKILLILVLFYFSPLSAKSPTFSLVKDVTGFVSNKKEQVFKKKTLEEKISLLEEVKVKLNEELTLKLKSFNFLYKKSLDLENELIEKKDKSKEDQLKFIKEKLASDQMIIDVLNEMDISFTPLYRAFNKKNKPTQESCALVVSTIENMYLNTAKESAKLPDSANTAIQIAQNICTVI